MNDSYRSDAGPQVSPLLTFNFGDRFLATVTGSRRLIVVNQLAEMLQPNLPFTSDEKLALSRFCQGRSGTATSP